MVRARMPGLEDELIRQVVHFLQELRSLDLIKKPGLSETLDWAQALTALNARGSGPGAYRGDLGCILKYREDSDLMEEALAQPGFKNKFPAQNRNGPLMDFTLPPPRELEALLGEAAPPSGQGLVGSVTALAHGLRARGVRIGQKSVMDGLRAAALVGVEQVEDLRLALAANLTVSQEEKEIFNSLFEALFRGRNPAASPEEERIGKVPSLTPEAASLRLAAPAPPKNRPRAVSPYSPVEVLARKSLKELSEGEFKWAEEYLTLHLEELLRKKSRRRKTRRRGRDRLPPDLAEVRLPGRGDPGTGQNPAPDQGTGAYHSAGRVRLHGRPHPVHAPPLPNLANGPGPARSRSSPFPPV